METEEKQTTALAKNNATGGRSLPTIAELYSDKELVIKRSELNVLLNQPPSKEWVRNHPIATKEIILPDGKKKEVPAQYIPIERLQWLMRYIFGTYTVQVTDYRLLANSVCVTVRLFYIDPLTGKEEVVDGVGAVPVQTDKGAGATEFDKIKTMAVQMALPAAKTFAEKDAITSLGKLFGSDLNRFEETQYFSQRSAIEELELHTLKQELAQLIGTCTNTKISDKIIDEVTTAEDKGEPTKEDYKTWVNQLKKNQPKK